MVNRLSSHPRKFSLFSVIILRHKRKTQACKIIILSFTSRSLSLASLLMDEQKATDRRSKAETGTRALAKKLYSCFYTFTEHLSEIGLNIT